MIEVRKGHTMATTKAPSVKTVLSERDARVFECGGRTFRAEKQEAYFPTAMGLRGYTFWTLGEDGEPPRGSFATLGEVKTAIQNRVTEGA